MPRNLSIQFGAMCPPITQQLVAQKLTADPKDIIFWQRCADSISLLAIHSMLSDSEKDRARKRLGAAICRGVVRVEGGDDA